VIYSLSLEDLLLDRSSRLETVNEACLSVSREAITSKLELAMSMRKYEECCMGKGDGKIQPRSWNDRHLVIQDPLLWRKVSDYSFHQVIDLNN